MEQPTKRCPACKEALPHEKFYKHRNRADGLQAHCKECLVRIQREAHEANPEQRRGWALKANYGIDLATWEAMFDAQGRRCAICRTDKTSGKCGYWHTDHCHATGTIRGILCTQCNLGLGRVEDVEWLRLAMQYLAATSSSP